MKEIARRIKLWGINQLYVIGGNGGNAAANAIQKECEATGVDCAVVGVPKSIDNDILLVTAFCFIIMSPQMPPQAQSCAHLVHAGLALWQQ